MNIQQVIETSNALEVLANGDLTDVEIVACFANHFALKQKNAERGAFWSKLFEAVYVPPKQ